VSFWEDPLLKAGVAAMVFALALTVVAVAATIALRSGSERAAASERGEPSVEPLRYGSPPPPPKPLTEKAEPQSQPLEDAQPKPDPQREPKTEPEPQSEPQQDVLPEAVADWPMPTDEQIEKASKPRHYDLPPGAIMGLTINALGVHNAPVFDSDDQWALNNGVSHVPDTSLPWSDAPQRNVYLEGHRLGWPGTGSHLIFYRLNWLEEGDIVMLKDRDGKRYRYRVSETLVVNPDDVWVMGQVVGRDMVTLQTCTPIPSFEKRLVVRADRT
jgi:sortase A